MKKVMTPLLGILLLCSMATSQAASAEAGTGSGAGGGSAPRRSSMTTAAASSLYNTAALLLRSSAVGGTPTPSTPKPLSNDRIDVTKPITGVRKALQYLSLDYAESRWADAIAYLERVAATSDDANALYHLGLICHEGSHNHEKNPADAIKYFTRAIALNSTESMIYLAGYHLGYYPRPADFSPDHAQGYKLLTQAHEKGNIRGAFEAGLCLWYGNGVEIDKKKAAKVWKSILPYINGYRVPLSVQTNFCVCLGEAFIQDYSTIDREQALELLTFAKEKGNTEAAGLLRRL